MAVLGFISERLAAPVEAVPDSGVPGSTVARGPAPGVAVLDASQRAIVSLADDTSAAVLGAPGSGKTTTLVELVAERIIARGYSPSEILVIAPHRRSATALRDRLALRVGVPTEGPLARTLNSAAYQIVRADATMRGDEPPRLLTGAEQDAVIADLLRGHQLEGTGPGWPDEIDREVLSLAGFRTELRELMMRATESGIRPEQLAALGSLHGRAEWAAAARFIDEYERVIDSFDARYLDATELVAEATALVRRGFGFEKLRLVVVDDMQEQGEGAIRFIAALASRGVRVVGFGDPDVAASTFRGSDPGAIAALGPRLGIPLETMSLAVVHRHGPRLRELVREVTSRVGTAGAGFHREAASVPASVPEDEAADGPDSRAERTTPPVLRIEAASTPGQYQQIARVLREHHLFGEIPWAKMAVIVRSGGQIQNIARALALAEVPTSSAAQSRSVSSEYASRQLIIAVALAIGRIEPDASTITGLLTGPLCGIDAIALRRLRLALRHEELAGEGTRTGDELLLEAVMTPGRFATIDSAAARSAGRLAEALAQARAEAERGASIEELLWMFWEKSRLASLWTTQALGSGLAADEANRHLDSVMTLFTSAKRFVERYPTEPAGRFIDDVLDAQVPEDSLTPQAAADTVWIGTPSGAVGSEFDVVVVAALQDGAWPNLQLRGAILAPGQLSAVSQGLPVGDIDERAEVLSDEVRMFALAVSRARRQVVLCATVSDDEQPSALLRFPCIRNAVAAHGDAEHPLSLRGLVGFLRRRLVTHGDPAAASALARLARSGVPGADPGDWYGMRDPSTTAPLVDLDDETAVVSVSPSKLETFEKSPLAWFIDTMAAAPSGIAAGIGTIVHAAMEQAGRIPADQLQTEDLSVDSLWQTIDAHWSELSFEAPWLAERQRRNARALVEGLSEYLLDAHRAGNSVVSAEGRFEVALGQMRLSGTIDRVERAPNGEITIIDLKTGRTVPSQKDVDAHAQLAAYQLAFHDGAIPGTSAEDAAGPAALLYVSGGTRGTSYQRRDQPLLDDAQLDEFRRRVIDAGSGMAEATFWGAADLPERDPKASLMYRIHLVAAVSA
ncbi:ATP-dependent DNA helicase [Okibacterium endophyticum]